MKIVVLAPSPDYAANAGARIRYGRIAPLLAEAGVELSIADIGGFDCHAAAVDVAIVSKCYDARALIAAHVLGARGTKVGFDLFDDYFSQSGDSRLEARRAWLGQMRALCSFALCSTEATAAVVASVAPGLPVHLLNDPAPGFDDQPLADQLREKASAALASRHISIAWFGIGDNPHFAVGLSDVAAFADALRPFAAAGFAANLTILTNERALDGAGLAMVAGLPLTTRLGLWSQEAEAELLARSLIAFLPVNAQRFSIAKSLNRGITALAGGCQLLSAGYPLYAALDPLVYRDGEALLADLQHGALRLSPESLGLFRGKVEQLASPALEAARLAAFLRDVPAPRPLAAAPLFLVHGAATTRAAHHLVHRAGGYSVRSPFADIPLDYDIMFEAAPGQRLTMLVAAPVRRALPAAWRRGALVRRVGGRKLWQLRAPVGGAGEWGDGGVESGEAWPAPSLPLQLALYPAVMRAIRARLAALFGPGRVIMAENATLPFAAADGGE